MIDPDTSLPTRATMIDPDTSLPTRATMIDLDTSLPACVSRSIQLLPLSQASQPHLAGQKAASLSRALADGHRVPDAFVVAPSHPLHRHSLSDALDRLGPGPYAVRSSGIAEDLVDASFAGQYETVLGCSSLDEVLVAIERVRASATAARATAYRGETTHGNAAMAVLVQRLVPATTSGVAFSANPVTGDDEVVIEAVTGLADRLLSGEADGDRWIDAGSGPKAQVDSGVLDVAVVTEIAALVRTLAAQRGQPQDIEWALADGQLFLIQARPISALPTRPALDVPEGRWVKDLGHFCGPMTPLGATLLLPAIEETIEAMCEDVGFPMLTVRQRSFGGEVYTQEVDLDGVHRTGAAPPWWVGAIAVRIIPSVRKRLKKADEAIEKLESYPRLWNDVWRDGCVERIRAAQGVDLQALSDDDLMAELDRVVDEVLVQHMGIHFKLTLPNTVGLYDLVRCCEELLGWEMPKTMDLLGGLSTASVAPVREIEAIAALVPDSVLEQGLQAVLASDAGADLRRWLDRWGGRSISLDPGEPTVGEREDLVMSLLRAVGDDHTEALRERREATRREALDKLDDAGRDRFLAALTYAERVYPLREDNVVYTEGLTLGLIRRVVVEIGRRLASSGLLSDASDVSYLERGELRGAIGGAEERDTLRARVRRRRNERAWVQAHPGPTVRGPATVPMPSMRGMPRGAQRIFGPMMWTMEHELTRTPDSTFDGRKIVGVGGAPGRYQGAVRVLRSPNELGRLRPGEVLVCPITDTNWGPFFSSAGALVIDGGGLLSHPAIIAREHGIPAVVATGCATTSLRDGDIVVVDGTKGVVELR